MGYRTLRRVAARAARWLRHRLDGLHGRYIIFDVGSSDGRQFLGRCQEDPNTVVYAFEPEPESFRNVLRNTQGLPNFRAFQLAVSDVDGHRPFNVASVIGNHSFYEFVDAVNDVWKRPYDGQMPSWVPDFEEKQQIEVETVRLDTFMSRMQIPYISYLHVDAQGEDVNVIKSLGDRIEHVRAGVIEVCLKPLYKGQFSKQDAMDFLVEKGFEITSAETEHFGLVENLYFRRR